MDQVYFTASYASIPIEKADEIRNLLMKSVNYEVSFTYSDPLIITEES